MPLQDCPEFVGRRLLLKDLPAVRDVFNAVLVPVGLDMPAGLFEPSGRAVPESMIYTGGTYLHTPLSVRHCPEIPHCPEMSDRFDYFYAGEMLPLAAHFFKVVFPRFWAIPPYERHRLRIVFSSTVTLKEMIAQSWFQVFVKGLGLTAQNFLQIQSPARFQRITVAACAFEELSLVHSVFADLAYFLRRQILPEDVQKQPGRVLFFSQERRKSGNIRVVNEGDLTRHLAERGMGIIHPDDMSFRDQLKIWASNPLVVSYNEDGIFGSMFFPRRRLVVLSHGKEMWVNQCLIDLANKNDARYVYDTAGLEAKGPGDGFHMNFCIPDTEKLASEIVELTMP